MARRLQKPEIHNHQAPDRRAFYRELHHNAIKRQQRRRYTERIKDRVLITIGICAAIYTVFDIATTAYEQRNQKPVTWVVVKDYVSSFIHNSLVIDKSNEYDEKPSPKTGKNQSHP